MTLKLTGSSSGSVSLQAPANAVSDRVLILPEDIGSAGQVLRNSATAGTLEFGSGNILQVVTATKTNQSSTSSTSATTTGLSLNITPVAQTSLIILTADVGCSGCTNSDFAVFFYIGLGSSPSIITGSFGDASGNHTRCTAFSRNDDNARGQSTNFKFVHDHDSIGQLTYSLMYSMESGGGAAFLNRVGSAADLVNRPRTISVLQAMEVST